MTVTAWRWSRDPAVRHPRRDVRQTPSVLHIKIVLPDADGKATPVPRHALLISDNPATPAPRRVVTAQDGTADVRLVPGNPRSTGPSIARAGQQWTQIDIAAGRDAVLR
jgi:hypothetical protein